MATRNYPQANADRTPVVGISEASFAPSEFRNPDRINAALSIAKRIPGHIEAVGFPEHAWELLVCTHAVPHIDSNFEDSLFLTQVLATEGHEFGDVGMKRPKNSEQSFEVKAGDIFVVDPQTLHWLNAPDGATDHPLFIARQWLAPRKEAPDMFRNIAYSLGVIWRGADEVDMRWRSIIPEKATQYFL